MNLTERGNGRIEPVIPDTIARSISIGNPADGAYAAKVMRESGGWAAAVSDSELVEGIKLLAQLAGVFTETAGGVTVAGALALASAGHFVPEDEIVLYITGNGLKTVEAPSESLEYLDVISPTIGDVTALTRTRTLTLI